MPANERTPLLGDDDGGTRNFWFNPRDNNGTYHDQFCRLVGIPSSDLPHGSKAPPIAPTSLYGRAIRTRRSQGRMYAFTAAISNTLLLSQVILGAAVTGLGASESSHVLITLFGAMNTIIAGVVAYLKSRGQPMRARMFRDDVERVVDEIENSEIMWLGISKNMHGYSEINSDEVTVRSELARLTRLYEKAITSNTMNNPDMYMSGQGFEGPNLALRKAGGGIPPVVPAGAAVVPAQSPVGPAVIAGSAPPPAQAVRDPDESPATAPPKPKEAPPEVKKDPVPDAKQDDGAAGDKKDSAVDAPKAATPDTVKDATPGAVKDTTAAATPGTSKDVDDKASDKKDDAKPANGASSSSADDEPAAAVPKDLEKDNPDAAPAKPREPS